MRDLCPDSQDRQECVPHAPRSQPIVELLLRLEIDLQHQIDAARTRAQQAEAHLARSRAETDQLVSRYEARCRGYEERLRRISLGVREYIQVTDHTQHALLALARELLGAWGAGDAMVPTDYVPPDDDATAGQETTTEHQPESLSLFVGGGSAEDETPEDEITDEHRLIDLQNRLDMGRLESANRLLLPMRNRRT